MPVATADELLAALRQSNLVPASRLDGWLDGHPTATTGTPRDLANQMVAARLLTRFQADLLLKGRPGETHIAKYKVLDLLGKGGMGAVYLCEHPDLKVLRAVKVLPASADEDRETRERFYREARAFAQLIHPNLVRGFDVDTDGTFHYIVMEYVDGVDLQVLVSRGGPLPIERAVNYARQAAVGLAHAHDRGWVHRDIKPANLAVDRTGLVRVLDMGLARTILEGTDSITRNFDDGFIRGTADYLAPEQANGDRLDGRCDIYSLGVTLYFLLTGRLPFEEVNTAQKLIAHLIKAPQPIRKLRPNLPEGLARVIEVMMAKEPEFRYQTGTDVADALAPWDAGPVPPTEDEIPRPRDDVHAPTDASAQTPEPTAPMSVPIGRPGRRRRQNSLILAVLAAVALLAIALVIVALRPGPPLRNGRPKDAPTESPFVGPYVPVTRAHGPKQAPFPGGHIEYLQGQVHETIASALNDPRLRTEANCRILLLDAFHEEQIDLDASALPQGIAIESARTDPPTQVMPPERIDPTKPLLRIRGGNRLAIRNLTVSGMGKFDIAVAWLDPGPGCQLHDIRVTKFTQTGVKLQNPVGEPSEPVQLSRLRISPEAGGPVDTCVAVATTGGRTARHLRVTECRLEGSADQGLQFTGGVEALEMSRCRLFNLRDGVRFAGSGTVRATLDGNTTARVTNPVWIEVPGEGDWVRLRSNLFYAGATSVARFGRAPPEGIDLFHGSQANYCNVGGCKTRTPGVPVTETDVLINMDPDPNKDADFLRYPATSTLAKAGPGGTPIGAPPR